MEKCWFVFRQSHFPPPSEPKPPENRSTGALCLGHLIPSLKDLDQVVNPSGPEPYPGNMPLWLTKKWDLKWDLHSSHNTKLSSDAQVPTGALPIDVRADASVAFRRSISNHWEFESLETTIIQPTMAYIQDSLEDDDVEVFLERKKVLGLSAWSLYMVSGLIVARGIQGRQADGSHAGVAAHGGVSLPQVVDVKLGADVHASAGAKQSYKKSTDFIWAVRLTKITKRLHSSRLTKETFVKGATFNKEDEVVEKAVEKVPVEDLLASEGFDVGPDVSIYEGDEDDAFVVPPEDKPEA